MGVSMGESIFTVPLRGQGRSSWQQKALPPFVDFDILRITKETSILGFWGSSKVVRNKKSFNRPLSAL